MNTCSLCKKVNGKGIKSCVCGKAGYCGVDCQKQDWGNHRKDCLQYVRKHVDGKGMGLFATRKINAGQQIDIIKHNVAAVTKNGTNFEAVTQILNGFGKLSKKDQMLWLNLADGGEVFKSELNPLHHCNDGGQLMKILMEPFYKKIGTEKVKKIVRIYSQNMSRDSTGGTRLNLVQAQLNHSCAPNVVCTMEGGGSMFLIRFVREIAKGEEIVESYFDSIDSTLGDRANRMKRLKQEGGFMCMCEVCSLTGKALEDHDKIRREIQNAYYQMNDLVQINNHTSRFEVEKMIEIKDVGENLIRLLKKIPNELIEVRRKMLLECYSVSARVMSTGNMPNIKPKEYKKELLEITKCLGPEEMKIVEEKVENVYHLHKMMITGLN